jgi:hypothetical protein
MAKKLEANGGGAEHEHSAELHAVDHVEPAAVEAIDQAAADQGLRVRRILTGRDFLPGRDAVATQQLMAPKAVGAYHPLGYVAGRVTGIERHENDYQGKTLQSVWGNGFFQASVAETGEILTAVTFISPGSAFGLLVEQAFAAGAETVELDLEIGLERTSRPTIYEWVVTSYATGAGQRLVKPIVERQQARLARRAAMALPKPSIAS